MTPRQLADELAALGLLLWPDRQRRLLGVREPPEVFAQRLRTRVVHRTTVETPDGRCRVTLIAQEAPLRGPFATLTDGERRALGDLLRQRAAELRAAEISDDGGMRREDR